MRYSPNPARTFEHFEDASEAWTPTGPVARTPRPVLLAVDEDEETLRGVSRELHQRYGNDYRVVCERFPRSALRRLCDFEAAGEEVALVLADQQMVEMSWMDFLTRVGETFPPPSGR